MLKAAMSNLFSFEKRPRSTGPIAGSLHYIPYFGNGASRTEKRHVRATKKAQRRRAHYRSLRKGGG